MIVALGPGGGILDQAPLPGVEVSAEENAETSVHPPGWPEGRPPPGWSDDDRAFASGEGPGREEDFLLRIARFPIYVVPPRGGDLVV